MRVAVAQFAPGKDKSANLARIAALTEDAARAGARLVVFPEGAMYGFGTPQDDLRPGAETLSGPFVEGLSELAALHDLTLVVGMFETIPGDQKVHNTAVVIDPRRGLAAAYRKRRLFDAFDDVESDRIRPGSEAPPLVEVDGFKIGIVICYELRFPGSIEEMADGGAELLVLPSAWVAGPLKEEHWTVLVRARAIDNTMYVAAAGQTGSTYCGRSMVVDPLGVVTASLGEGEGVTTAEVSKDRLARVRARLPVLRHRRAASDALTGGAGARLPSSPTTVRGGRARRPVGARSNRQASPECGQPPYA